MPSPIGHAIGGIAGGWTAAGRPAASRRWMGEALLLGAAGMFPDVDLLFGAHSGATHSVGAAAIAAGVAWIGAWLVFRANAYSAPARSAGARASWTTDGARAARLALAVAAAWMSHVALDWLGEDTSAPLGVMALWPFSAEHYLSPVSIMPAITRRYWLPGFWTQNFRALVFELAILLPVLAAVWVVRRKPYRYS